VNRKNTYFVSIAIFALIVLIAGCAQPTEKKPAETPPQITATHEKTETGPAVSQADQKIVSDLMLQLNSDVANYAASYKKSREEIYWGGHSGATNKAYNSTISITIKNNEILNYSFRQEAEGGPFSSFERQEENYYQYYNVSKKVLCTQKFIQYTECEADERPIPPALGGKLTGCKATIYPDGYGKCICNGETIPIESSSGLPCSEKVNTENVTFKWIDSSAIYYPENRTGICYFYGENLKTGEFWAFECENKPILMPTGYNLTDFKGIKCQGPAMGACCEIIPQKELLSCSQENPINFDTEAKKEIIGYLQTVNITGISEEDNHNGHCYSFSYSNLNQTFCFDDQKLISFAQWGTNIKEAGLTNVDINRIEKTQLL
jgi:hypothetical protein